MYGAKRRKDELVITTEQTHYRFDDDGSGGPAPTGSGPLDALTFEEMEAELKRRHGPYVNNVAEHPLVQAWRQGYEIEWTPAPCPYPVGSQVRRHGREMEDKSERLAERLRSRVYEVTQAHPLYSKVETKRGPQWIANRLLEIAEAEAQS